MNSVTVSQVMSTSLTSLLEEQNLTQVAAIFDHVDFHHLPVVDNQRVVGMVSQRDLLRATVAGSDASAVARTREIRHLEQTFVRDVMRTQVVTARADESLQVAAQRMLDARVDALPVVAQNGLLVGIVTAHDLLRYLSLSGEIARTRA